MFITKEQADQRLKSPRNLSNWWARRKGQDAARWRRPCLPPTEINQYQRPFWETGWREMQPEEPVEKGNGDGL